MEQQKGPTTISIPKLEQRLDLHKETKKRFKAIDWTQGAIETYLKLMPLRSKHQGPKSTKIIETKTVWLFQFWSGLCTITYIQKDHTFGSLFCWKEFCV